MKQSEKALYQSPETRELDLMAEQPICAVSSSSPVPPIDGDTEGFSPVVDFEW